MTTITTRSKNKPEDEVVEFSSRETSESDLEDIDHLYSFRTMKASVQGIIPKVKPYVIYCYNATGLYLFWICLHYISAKMYTYYCVPNFFTGFIISPFLVSAPHCRAIRWVVHNGGNTIDNMWVMLATWICSKVFMGVEKNNKKPTNEKKEEKTD